MTDLPFADASDGGSLAIVTCMDTRIDSTGFFELWQMPLHVIRNAGGRVTSDVLRSLAVSCTMDVRQIAIVHHTHCRMAEQTDGQIRQLLPPGAGEGLELLTIEDSRAALRQDVGNVVESTLIPRGVRVTGLVYDLDSRTVREVDSAEECQAQPL